MFIHILLNEKEEFEQPGNFIVSNPNQRNMNPDFKIKTYTNSPENMPQFLVEIKKKMIFLLKIVKVFFNVLSKI